VYGPSNSADGDTDLWKEHAERLVKLLHRIVQDGGDTEGAPTASLVDCAAMKVASACGLIELMQVQMCSDVLEPRQWNSLGWSLQVWMQ
jgi:hypothetical protein